MKMTKKIVLGALAAMALVLSGCNGGMLPTVGEEEDSINGRLIKGVTAKAYIGEKDGDGVENKTDKADREMQFFATKHYGAFAALTLKGEKKNTTAANGQLGYVFNYSENKDKTVNFITIGYRNHDGIVDSYVSQFYNISTDEFDAPNFGVSKDATKADGKTAKVKGTDFFEYNMADVTAEVLETIKESKKPTEIMYKDNGAIFFKIANFDDVYTAADDELSIGVEVIAEEEDGKKGSYTINYYKTLKNYKKVANSTPVKTVTVPATVTGYTKKTQTKMGCYVNIYAGKTLNGFWRFSEIKGEDVPVEE